MDMHGGASLPSLFVAEAGNGCGDESHPGPEVNQLVINQVCRGLRFSHS
jgi:hypothetical protein